MPWQRRSAQHLSAALALAVVAGLAWQQGAARRSDELLLKAVASGHDAAAKDLSAAAQDKKAIEEKEGAVSILIVDGLY
jgi:hypothetical protein